MYKDTKQRKGRSLVVWRESQGEVGTRQSKDSLPKASERVSQIWITESSKRWVNSDSPLWLLIRVTQGDLKDADAWGPSSKSMEVQSKPQYCFRGKKSSVGDPMCCQD